MIGALLRTAWRACLRTLGTARAKRHLRAGDRLMARQDAGGAVRAYRAAVSMAPWLGAARNDLGIALMAAGDLRAGEAEFHLATQAVPVCGEAHLNLAQYFLNTSRPGAARLQLREAALHAAGHRRLPHLQGLCALAFGDAEAAAGQLSAAWRADRTDRDVTSGYLMALSYAESVTPEALCAAHREWAAALPARDAQSEGARQPHALPAAPWRIGYVSPDFRDHAVRYFFEPLIRHHDRARFHVYCYSDVRDADDYTRDLRGRAEGWRDTADMDDAALADLVRRDAIDVLVDLAGHTAGNRLALLAARLAPLQVTGLGYPPTTGLSTIDCKLSDPVADPPGADSHYAERLLRLPGTFWCFAPPAQAPEVAPPPMSSAGHATFGFVGNLAKVSNGALQAWAAILAGAPRSRMLMKCPTLDDAAVREFTQQRLRAAGIDPARVGFEGRSDLGGFLAAYARIDVILDTFPYNGGTTTCHALWMGVPVVTHAGAILLSRMGASMLHAVGLDEFVAQSWREYAEVALRLAGEPGRLAQLRAALRERMRKSTLADGARFTAGLEAALVRAMQDRQSLPGAG